MVYLKPHFKALYTLNSKLPQNSTAWSQLLEKYRYEQGLSLEFPNVTLKAAETCLHMLQKLFLNGPGPGILFLQSKKKKD